MVTTVASALFPPASPRLKGRIAGALYLLTIVAGAVALSLHGPLNVAANIAADACYVVVTLLLYDLFAPVNRGISFVAAIFSLTGCAVGALSTFHLSGFPIHSLVFFGVYCLLLAYLILRSALLPRWVGVLMAIAGLGWLTYVEPSFAKSLFMPFLFTTGMLGEGSLTISLLAGVRERS